MHDAKPFWLVGLVRTALTGAIAYFVAVFILLVLIRVSKLPSGPLWVPEFQGVFLFIMTVGVTVFLAIPYFMKEWDAGLRTFSMFASTFLLAMAVFSQTGTYDPNVPLQYLTSHVFVPIERKLRV
jgi:hypothetical protein